MSHAGRYLTTGRAAMAAAVAVPLAAAAILLPFRAAWSNTNVALLLVVAVVAVAAVGNRAAGAVAAVSAFAWFDFFFTRPYYRFSIRSSSDVTTAVLLLITGLAVSQLAARARNQRAIAITEERYLAQIRQAAGLGRTQSSPFAAIDLVKEQLTELLDLEECRFEYGSLVGHPARLEPDGTVIKEHRRWDVGHFGLPSEEIELRAFGNGQYFGRFMLTPKPGSAPSLQARLVAVTLADQAGRAISSSQVARRAGPGG
jgi:Domain of unknown function (DUF4118)